MSYSNVDFIRLPTCALSAHSMYGLVRVSGGKGTNHNLLVPLIISKTYPIKF